MFIPKIKNIPKRKNEIKVNIDWGASIRSCKECEKSNIGNIIFDYFKPGLPNYLIKYQNGICYINESVLMLIIRMANPYQQDRKIELVSREEFIKILRGEGDKKCNEQ
jgi:hypothetical protein